MRWTHVSIGLVLFLTVTTRSAVGQGRDAATADALFREARALMKERKFDIACPKLAESQRLDPAAGTAINLGECWDKLGRLADALQAYRDALDLLKAGDSRVAPVKKQIASLEQRVPKLTIRLGPGAPAGTTVRRDDVELGAASLGVALPVNPGEHWIVATAPGRKESRRNVHLAEKQSAVVELEFEEASSDPGGSPSAVAAPQADAAGEVAKYTGRPASQPEHVAPGAGAASDTSGPTGALGNSSSGTAARDAGTLTADQNGRGGPLRTIGYVAGAAGIAALGTAGVYYLKARSVGTNCRSSAECERLTDEEQGYLDAATLWGIGGGIGVAGGLALVFFLAPNRSETALNTLGFTPTTAGYTLHLKGTW